MSHYIELRILGRLDPSFGRLLLAFYDDWTMRTPLGSLPAEEYLRRAHAELANIFASAESGNGVVKLTARTIDLHVEIRSFGEDVEFFIDQVLPRALESLKEGWYIYEESEHRTFLRFDPRTRKVTRQLQMRDSWRKKQKKALLLRGESEWEREYGSMTAHQWRSAINRLLKLIAEPARLALVLAGKSKEFPALESWQDLHAVYFTVLNLEDGFGHVRRKGFLNLVEVKQLRAFDSAFRAYLPEDDTSNAAFLLDPRWRTICEHARSFCEHSPLHVDPPKSQS